MSQDIRKLLKNRKDDEVALSQNHRATFQKLVQTKLHQNTSKKKKLVKILSIAASVAILLSVCSMLDFRTSTEEIPENNPSKKITLGTISPEFNTLETYYVNSINLEISKIDFDESNTEIIDGYLLKIAELTNEYKILTQELNTKGVNNVTIEALIRNLQLRLQLLQQLQKQLSQFKNLNSNNDEKQIL